MIDSRLGREVSEHLLFPAGSQAVWVTADSWAQMGLWPPPEHPIGPFITRNIASRATCVHWVVLVHGQAAIDAKQLKDNHHELPPACSAYFLNNLLPAWVTLNDLLNVTMVVLLGNSVQSVATKAEKIIRQLLYIIKPAPCYDMKWSGASLLSIGEADFSFAASLIQNDVERFNLSFSLLATSLEPETSVLARFGDSAKHIEYIRQQRRSAVKFQVDARDLGSAVGCQKFDIILFLFPHTGIEHSESHGSNTDLLDLFFANAKPLLSNGSAEIHVALLEGQYKKWNIKGLLKQRGLKRSRFLTFCYEWFPQYKNSRGFTDESFATMDNRYNATLHIFQLSQRT
uniref:25S rRNA (uridine-N(3))-methyltransferase BMT5-like domain-containing protein n=1 Tax=Haptolina ericina TaxID=156174 RepID=A0A7S3AEQ5_9EUKA